MARHSLFTGYLLISLLFITVKLATPVFLNRTLIPAGEDYTFSQEYSPRPEDNHFIYNNLQKFNISQLNEDPQRFSIFLKDRQDKIQGGIIVSVYSQAIYINGLWLDESLRKQGYGKKLLSMAEEEGRKRKKIYSNVETFDFQAKDFYLSQGYKIVGEIKNHLRNHSKIYLRKII